VARQSFGSIMTLRSLVIALVLATAIGACRDLPLEPSAAPPELPPGSEALTPLATYADWWRATEECAGRPGDMTRVSWFVVPNRASFLYGDAKYDGYWWDRVHWILLAGEKVSNGMLVRHEMLHEILGRGDHPPAYFQGRCATVVICEGICRTGD
jgi:hypothetical protein